MLKMRKRATVTGTLALALTLAACTTSTDTEGSSPPNTSATSSGGDSTSVVPWAASGEAPDSTVTVCFFSGPEFDTIQKHSEDFTALTGGKIKIEMVSIPVDQQLAVTLNQLRSSSVCDIVDGNSQQGPDLEPYLLPIDSMVADEALLNSSMYDLSDFPQGVLDVTSGDRGLMSLPFSADVQMIFYRTDLMDEWGITVPEPPAAWTWQEFEANLQIMQEKITENNLDMTPIAIPGARDATGAIYGLAAMWGAGGNPFDGDEPNFNDPKAVEGLSRWSGLLNTLELASPGSPTYQYNELLVALQQGNVPMITEWNAAVTTLNDPDESPITAGNLGFALLPYDESLPADTPRVFPTTHALAISASSENPEAAFSFAAWYTSPEIALEIAKERSSGARTSVLTNPEVLATNPALDTVAYSNALYHSLPKIASFGNLLNNVVGPNVNSVFTEQVTPEQGMADMQSAAEDLLKKSGN